MKNGNSDVDCVAELTRIKELESEYRTLKARMEQVKAEVKTRLAAMEAGFPAEMRAEASQGRRPVVKKPRPISDKLSIAAGRAINIAWKKKKTPEVCKANGIAAASKAAKKYGMDSIPAQVLRLIDKKIKLRFNL
jgi:hypothetical protein